MGRHDREMDGRPRLLNCWTLLRGLLRHRRLFFRLIHWQGHYADVANCFLWPLLHPSAMTFSGASPGTTWRPQLLYPADWRSFLAVNTAFAEAAAEERSAPWC
ncbi:MAG: hypothetical protein U0837_08650 [Dehalococcoidia bacterium]